jgi:hypothetical protein
MPVDVGVHLLHQILPKYPQLARVGKQGLHAKHSDGVAALRVLLAARKNFLVDLEGNAEVELKRYLF